MPRHAAERAAARAARAARAAARPLLRAYLPRAPPVPVSGRYVKDKSAAYDVVIVDSSDPVGPAETLFTSTFYRALRGAMRPGAIMCNQGECVWLHLDLIGEVTRSQRTHGLSPHVTCHPASHT